MLQNVTKRMRSLIGKRAWGERAPVAICPFDKEPIYTGGETHGGRLWHRNCWQRYQVARIRSKGAKRGYYAEHEVPALNPAVPFESSTLPGVGLSNPGLYTAKLGMKPYVYPAICGLCGEDVALVKGKWTCSHCGVLEQGEVASDTGDLNPRPKRQASVWLRLGDACDYEQFDNMFDAGGRAASAWDPDGRKRYMPDIRKTGKYGVEYQRFEGPFNYVSLFWGDKDAQPVRDISNSDIAEFKRGFRDELMLGSSNPKKMVYGVSVGNKFGLTTRREEAISTARERGGKIFAMPWTQYRGTGSHDPYGRDAPTFMVLADEIPVPAGPAVPLVKKTTGNPYLPDEDAPDSTVKVFLTQGQGWRLLNWHGGQWTPTYSLGSSATHGVPLNIAKAALSELRGIDKSKLPPKDVRDLHSVIAMVEMAIRRAERARNPLFATNDIRPYTQFGSMGVSNPTYYQEMMSKYGVPFDPHRVKSSGGFRFGDRVEMASNVESWQSGIRLGQQGTVWAIAGFGGTKSVSPDPLGKMIFVKWDDGQPASVWKGTLKRIGRATMNPSGPPGPPENTASYFDDKKRCFVIPRPIYQVWWMEKGHGAVIATVVADTQREAIRKAKKKWGARMERGGVGTKVLFRKGDYHSFYSPPKVDLL